MVMETTNTGRRTSPGLPHDLQPRRDVGALLLP